MRILTVFTFFSTIYTVFGAEIAALSPKTAEIIVNSIKIIEGTNSSYPYGIKSIQIKGNTQEKREKYARMICFNTVNKNYIRWQKSGKTNQFMVFLGNRYCPVQGDKTGLNRHWINNLRKVSKLNF